MQFLPKNFSRIGSYTDLQYGSAAAFRLLFHSELETLLENMALGVLDKIDATVRAGGHCRGGSSILTLYKADPMGGMPTQFSEFDNKPFVMRSQLACIHALRGRVESNRGVKTHNLLSMFIPLGIDETAIEEQLLIDLNTLGARRGDVAHKGLHAVTALPDPREDKILAERIVRALEDFEVLLNAII